MNMKYFSVTFAIAALAVPVCAQDNPLIPGREGNNDLVQVRLIHAVPDAPAATISIGGTQLFQDIEPKQITAFKTLPKQDNTEVIIKLADGRQLKTTEQFDFDDDDSMYTVLVTADESGPNPKVVVLESDDDTGDVDIGEADEIEVTVINASPQHKSLKVELGDDDLVDGVNYSEADDDDVKRGSYSMKVIDTQGNNAVVATEQVSLTGAGSYTILVMGDNDVRVVNDLSPDLQRGAAGSNAAGGATGAGMTTRSQSQQTTGPGTMGAMSASTGAESGSDVSTTGTMSGTSMSTMSVTNPGM